MPEYRRIYLPGATYFFTIVTYKRCPLFLDENARKLLNEAIENVMVKRPFDILAMCLLPDHIHMLVTLPDSDTDYSTRIREIKRLFTISYQKQTGIVLVKNKSRKNKKEAEIWQRRFWEHTIRDENDLQNHFDYIHFNPVKHGYVEALDEWQWSSFHHYVEMGVYPKSQVNRMKNNPFKGDFGE